MTAEKLPTFFCRNCFHTTTHRKIDGLLVCDRCGKSEPTHPVFLPDRQ